MGGANARRVEIALMQANDFIRKWGPGGPAHELTERAGAQADRKSVV